MSKSILYVLLFAAIFGLGIFTAYTYFQNKQEEITNKQSTVLLEKIEKVCKLVTVEGNFSERYDETNIRQFTVYFPLPSTFHFSKKASLHVTGKVLVGYDMKNIEITADSTSKTIILSNIPEPEILSIDHDVQYKNLEESWFNNFTPEDYTAINKNAKEMLKNKVKEGTLIEEAKQQGNQIIEVINFMTEAAGWKLEVAKQPINISTEDLFNN